MVEEVLFGSSSPLVISAILVWTLVVATASYSVVAHAIVAIRLKDLRRISLKSFGRALLEFLILAAVLVTSRGAVYQLMEWLYLVANPGVTSVGIWSRHPWWVAMILGPCLGSAVAVIRSKQPANAA